MDQRFAKFLCFTFHPRITSLKAKSSHVTTFVLAHPVGNKMHKAFPLPVTEFPLPKELPTVKKDSCHCQKKREATARKIALLSMTRRNCQSKVADTLRKFEQWQFRIQQYLQHEHYTLWEVIEFEDSYVVPESSPSTTTTDTIIGETGTKSGRTVTLTAEDMQRKKNDVKAAILKTFDGNEATKKTKKNLLKQQYGNFKEEGLKTLEQTSDLDTISPDDLYNHLKVYESEVQKKSEPNSQNITFISSAKHNSGNEDGNTDWSYMENDEEDHALVADEVAPIEFALMANTSAESNISYLSDYEPFDGGYVSFGQGGCKITGKGTIKTGKLEFENMYFVKDLKYNLFSVSQICDNKNSVLFIDSECIVLGRDFKMLDDANVLLRTPRQDNIYSINLNNIVPHKDLTCLVAKASVDECMKWNMRLGHLIFKTMNKLVRHNLVRGLPTKCFENDHNCTACLKGKQHKESSRLSAALSQIHSRTTSPPSLHLHHHPLHHHLPHHRSVIITTIHPSTSPPRHHGCNSRNHLHQPLSPPSSPNRHHHDPAAAGNTKAKGVFGFEVSTNSNAFVVCQHQGFECVWFSINTVKERLVVNLTAIGFALRVRLVVQKYNRVAFGIAGNPKGVAD
nr:putative ribonuclease H-like domain-containing protein [Tanacetum cinerariifolium]